MLVEWCFNYNLLFFFRQVVDTSGDEDDGMDETILPVDYNTAGVSINRSIHFIII